jgi:hypoxanthine phosphoribosyltransferase
MIEISLSNTFDKNLFVIPDHYADDISSVLIPRGLIKDRVRKLAIDIANDSTNPIVACCVLKGAHVFFASLTSCLMSLPGKSGKSIPITFEFIKVSDVSSPFLHL